MKNSVLWMVGAVVVIAVGAWFYMSKTSTDTTPAVATYTEERFRFLTDNQDLVVQYSADGDFAKVNYRGTNYELPVAISASGARYANVDETIVFWEHQGEAMFELNGEVVVEGAKREGAEVKKADASSPLLNTVWSWDETTYDGEPTIMPKEAKSFFISFKEGNQFSATTDCNNLMGNYAAVNQNIDFTDVASTKMACEGESQEAAFAEMLDKVSTFEVEGTTLTLGLGTGVMTLSKAN